MQGGDESVGASLQLVKAPLCLGDEACRALMGGDQLIERRRSFGQLGDGALEADEQFFKADFR